MSGRDASLVTPATAIATWAIAATGVAAIAVAGDRTVFRAEPASPAVIATVGLIGALAIGWPIWSFGRLARAFVAGQGLIVVWAAATTIGEAIAATGTWAIACGLAFTAAWGVWRRADAIAPSWTAIVTITVGGAAIAVLRTSFGCRW